MKKIVLTMFLGSFLSFFSRAQVDIDLGITGGTSFYLGDINPEKLFYNPKIAYGGFIRFNAPDARYGLRINGLLTMIEATDKDFKNRYQQNRNASFKTAISEVSVYLEFNFLPFHVPVKSVRYKKFSPFLLSGLTYSHTLSTKSSFVLPLGLGFKFLIHGKLSGHIEWIMKKSFTDQFDNLSDPINTGNSSIFFNTDWYSYTGISLSFELFEGTKKCKSYEDYRRKENLKRKLKNK